MANFKLMNGMFVRITKDVPGLTKNKEYQVLLSSGLMGATLSFVGVKGVYVVKTAGKWLEPVMDQFYDFN